MCDSTVCNQSLCDQLPPECKYGEKLVSYYRSDSCCPQHVCGEFPVDWLTLRLNHHCANSLTPHRSAAWLLLMPSWIIKPSTLRFYDLSFLILVQSVILTTVNPASSPPAEATRLWLPPKLTAAAVSLTSAVSSFSAVLWQIYHQPISIKLKHVVKLTACFLQCAPPVWN